MTAMLTPSSVRTIAVATTTTTTTATTIGKTTTPATTTVMPAAALSKATTLSSIPVRAIPVPNTNKLILAGPCIVFRTATVAEQVQALRQEKKKVAAVAATVATSTTTTTAVKSEVPELLRCKRRADLGKLGFPETKPVSVSRRNARERNRVKLVNQGFDTLREHVPNGKKNRKMSKVDTLRSAVDYIRQLQELIDEHDEKMDVSSSETSPSDVTITDDSSPLVDDRLSLEEMSESPKNSLTPTKTENTTMTELSVVNIASDNVIKDTLNNNNNNNTFVNFNVDNNHVSSEQTMDVLQQVNGVQQLNTVQQVNLNQVNTGRNVTLQVNGSKVQVNNNRQQVNAAQQVNTVSAQQLLTSLNSLNTTSFVNTASLISAQTASCNPSSSTQAAPITTTTTASPLPQTITLITLPIHPQPPPISPNNTADDVFLPDTQPRIRTIAPAGQQSTVSTGTIATLTTLQGMGSLSGQGLTISQPCRRHLSFSEPEPERTVQIQPRLSLSEQSLLVNNQQQRQQQQLEQSAGLLVNNQQQRQQQQLEQSAGLLVNNQQQRQQQQLEQSAGLLVNNQQQQQQQQSPPPPTSQQQQQQHISFTLLPGQNVGDLSLLNSNLNTNTLTLVPQTFSIDQQQNQQQQQPSPEQPHFTTLSNLTLPNQSVNAAFSFDQSTSLPLTDNHGYHHQDQFQTLVAPSNVAMKQPQLQVDQVPSPSLSTSSSHTSESSYESYESLGSLEEDLQDISNWITELCNSQDIHGHCDTDDGVSFLTYSDTDNL